MTAYLRVCAGVFAAVTVVFGLAAFVVPPLVLGAAVGGLGLLVIVRALGSPDDIRWRRVVAGLHLVAAVAAAVYAVAALGAGGRADAYEPGVMQAVFLGVAAWCAVASVVFWRARGKAAGGGQP